jgi:hypothetical protein
MELGFYHPSKGYWQTNTEPTEAQRALYPEGTIEVDLKPSELHTFNGSTWEAPTAETLSAIAAQTVRFERDKLLLEVDTVVSNPLRWASLSTEAQAAWAAYRQELLDVPQQSGFPADITWPTKPS